MRGTITETSIRALKSGQLRMSSRLTGFGVRRTPGGKVRYFIRRVVGNKDIRKTIGKYPEISPQKARLLAQKELSRLPARGLSHHNESDTPSTFPGQAEALTQEVTDRQTTTTSHHQAEHASSVERRLNQLLQANALLLEKVRRLLDGQQGEEPPQTSPTLDAFVEQRLFPHWKSLSESAQRSYFGTYHRNIQPTFGQVPMHSLTAANIEPWFSAMSRTPRTANLARSLLIRLLRLAEQDGHIQEVPKLRIRNFKTSKRAALSEKQLGTLMAHLQSLLSTRSSPHLWAVITILNTGERRESCVALHMNEVDFDRQVITRVRKGDKVEPLPITDFAAQWLAMIKPKDGGYFFPSKHSATGHINGRTLLDWFKRECKKIGVVDHNGKPPCIHSLRHTWASTLARNGVTITHIQRLLGHSSLKTTLRYITPDSEAARKAANVVTETRVALPYSNATGHVRTKSEATPGSRSGRPKVDPRMRLSATSAQRLILPAVAMLGRASMRELMERTKIPPRKLRAHVGRLVRLGKLVRHGHAESSYYVLGGTATP